MNVSKYCIHSFGIGAATTAAVRGIEDSVIKTLGRWKSLVYLKYMRIPRQQLIPHSDQLVAVNLCIQYALCIQSSCIVLLDERASGFSWQDVLLKSSTLSPSHGLQGQRGGAGVGRSPSFTSATATLRGIPLWLVRGC